MKIQISIYQSIRVLTFLFLFLALNDPANAQPEGFRIDPPNWWVDMEANHLELMVYGKNIQSYGVEVDYPGISILYRIEGDSPNYLFLQLDIDSNAKPGEVKFIFSKSILKNFSIKYPFLERIENSGNRKGFDSSDLMYLLMPDRFANGNYDNDDLPGFREKSDRSNPDGRHGGDIEGIIRSLDYIESLGMTALWLNPVYENNQEKNSYHGYSITDYYRVDERLGGNEAYLQLAKACDERGIKLVKDMIFNHCGSFHQWMNDLPFQDWIHHHDTFQRTSYRASTVFDPHASEADKHKFLKGWFDTTMPDLNQKHPQLKNYLIQQSIWWIESFHLKGIRMDTQAYPDKDVMRDWALRIKLEYPNLALIGEIWEGQVGFITFWKNPSGEYHSGLDGIFDFPLHDAVKMGLKENEGWWEGFSRMYGTLAQDYLMESPENNLIFPDNHDVERIFEVLNQDYALWEMAMVFYYTMRGIPQIYYGTEILMTGNKSKGDGAIRKDMPGGWLEDESSAFKGRNLNKQEMKAFRQMQKLGEWRKNHAWMHSSKLVHFIPENGVYVYFRYNDSQSLMVVLNKNDKDIEIPTQRFSEQLKNFQQGIEVLSRQIYPSLKNLLIPARKAVIIELQ